MEAADFVLSVARFSFQVFQTVSSAAVLALTAGWKYSRQRFGTKAYVLAFIPVVNFERLYDLHWNINVWTDEEVLSWRTSQMSTYNAIAVAVCYIDTCEPDANDAGCHFCEYRYHGTTASQYVLGALECTGLVCQ